MTSPSATIQQPESSRPLRWLIPWAGATALLLLPLVAMQFTAEVNWDPFDFAVAAALLYGAVLSFQLSTRNARNTFFRAACGLAVLTVLMLIWANLAVGIIGSENNPANLMYLGVLAVGIIGAVIARLRSGGMARVLYAMATAQGLIAVIAVIGGMGLPYGGAAEILLINAFFVALFVASALLFRLAARGGRDTATA